MPAKHAKNAKRIIIPLAEQPRRRSAKPQRLVQLQHGIPLRCEFTSLGRTFVIVVGKDDMPHVLRLMTLAGIRYLKSGR